MTVRSKYSSPPAPEMDLDPDWAPQLPSIWDDPEEEAELTAATPPWPQTGRGSAWLEPGAWIQAEHAVGRALAETTAAVVRLDERLLGMDPEARAGARLRLALQAVPDLLWAEGARLRPEHLALADADRIGGGEDAPVLARASWAVRRMTAGPGLEGDTLEPEGIRTFLGVGAVPERWPDGDDQRLDLSTQGLLEDRRLDPAALQEWCGAVQALGGVHPLTRAVAGGALWTGLGVTDAARLLEPALVMGALGAAAGQGGVMALPVGAPRVLSGGGGDTEHRLAKGLTRLADGARSALMQLDRVAAWQLRATRATDSLKGRAPANLIALLAARPVVSARDVAGALDLTDRHARRLIETFATRGLVRELTGHTRFRFWAAKV